MPVVRVLVIGGPAVGKSALCRKFVDEAWLERGDRATELPLEHKRVKMLTVEGAPCRVEILDAFSWRLTDMTSLGELFEEFSNIQGVLMVYDITRASSLAELNELWYVSLAILTRSRISELSDPPACFLVGCKSDLEDAREVSSEQGAALAESWGIPWFEVSAKLDLVSVQRIFASLVVQVHARARAEQRESGCMVM